MELAPAPPEAPTPVKPVPVTKAKPKPANGSGAIARLDEEVSRLNDLIAEAQLTLEKYEYKLSVIEEVRGMLG